MGRPTTMMEFGLRAADLLAGFLGGLTYALKFSRGAPAQGVVVIIIGALAAAYLGRDVAAWLHVSDGAGGYLTGVGAHALLFFAIDEIKRRLSGKK
jgi:hypothetical protein